MENLKVESKLKIGKRVKINNTDYYAYYGFSDCILIVKDIKYNKSDNINLDNILMLNLKTINGKSIEGEYNDIWISETDVDFSVQ